MWILLLTLYINLLTVCQIVFGRGVCVRAMACEWYELCILPKL